MKRTLLTAVVLAALVPGLATAMGCDRKHDQEAMSCAEGTSYDAETGNCVPVANT